MVNLNRVYAVMLRHIYIIRRSYTTLTDLFYFPLFDLMIYGFMSLWMSKLSPVNATVTTTVMVINFIVWQAVLIRLAVDIIQGILEEIWSKNLINLFSAPIFFVEWIIGLACVGLVKAVIEFLFIAAAAWLIFGVPIAHITPIFLPTVLLCVTSGWMLGLIGLSFVLRWGERAYFMCYGIGGIMVPFCGVFYPLDVLPVWMQWVGALIPVSRLFSEVRHLIERGMYDSNLLYLMSLWTLGYCALLFLLVRYQFKHARSKGLDRLYA